MAFLMEKAIVDWRMELIEEKKHKEKAKEKMTMKKMMKKMIALTKEPSNADGKFCQLME